MKDFKKEALDFLKDIIIILVVVIVIRTFFVMPFQINGQSMADSYYDREFIIVDRFSYLDLPFLGRTQEVERGDVIVFAPGVSKTQKYFIKRVIALPGETLKIENGEVFIQKVGANDFQKINESAYLNETNIGKTRVKGQNNTSEFIIPEGEFFVMGDNRNHSTDSRTCFRTCSTRDNFISHDEILGKVFIDMGYFHFGTFSFTHPDLDIRTFPKFFNSPGTHSYEL